MKSISLLFLFLSLAACDSQMDDQSLIKTTQFSAVNPDFNTRDFKLNNQNHKVLIAIMDTGIDYNHPELINNLHFKLDENNQPISTGWDFAGNDGRPAPYIARTDFFNEKISLPDRNESFKNLSALKDLVTENPELKELFPIERNLEKEIDETVSHGTHVAGLASYDSPEIGLLPYRVLPINRPTKQESKDPNIVIKKFSDVLILALDRAMNDGAKVVNMSIGFAGTKDSLGASKEAFDTFKERLTEIVQRNPNTYFVIAAGNDGKWIDGKSVLELPCYLPEKNVLCVSALSEDMSVATFSNIVINNEINTIFAWGENILSTVPTHTCYSEKLKYDSLSIDKTSRDAFAQIAHTECEKSQSFQKMSGTSMASPIVARKIAKIIAAHPDFSLSQVKNNLFENAIASKLGSLDVMKLPIEKPSWYDTQLSGKKSSKWSFMFLKTTPKEAR